MFQENQTLVVSKDAPFHAGRTGYFCFSSGDAVILAESPEPQERNTYFVVSTSNILKGE